jgi:hypothetical protein
LHRAAKRHADELNYFSSFQRRPEARGSTLDKFKNLDSHQCDLTSRIGR